jgi:histidine triad (HIT) family protein
MVQESDEFLAFRDLNPQAPIHVLVIPRRHIESVADLEAEDGSLGGRLLFAATEIARNLGLDESGYRLVANTGEDGGQTVPHLHLHLLGGRAMSWPPG